MKRKDELPPCPVALTVGVIGSKWKLLILRELLAGARRFGELFRALEGISKKVLVESLRALEADGVVVRTEHPGNVPTVDYAFTPLGRALLPIFDAMAAWGEAYRRTAPEIRPLRPDEYAAAATLWLEANLEAHPFVPEAYWRAYLSRLPEALAGAETLGYFREGRLLGFVGLRGDFVEGLFVRRGARSQGIGHTLLAAVRKRHEALETSAFRKNAVAVRFWLREGFAVVREEGDAEVGESVLALRWRRGLP